MNVGDHSDLSGHSHSVLSGAMDTDDLLSGIDDTFSHGDSRKRDHKISRHEYEQKQMSHSLQLLKIEISQKNLIIDNLKAEHMNKVEELEERLNDALHSKHLIQARLENVLSIQQTEAQRREFKTQQEIRAILDRQRELEQTNKSLQAKTEDIRHQLQRESQLTEQQYIELKAMPIDNIGLKDYFALRLYEESRPLRIETNNLKAQRDKLSIEIAEVSNNLHTKEHNLAQTKRSLSQKTIEVQSLTDECKQTKDMLQSYTAKAQQFDEVKRARDRFEADLFDLQKKYSYEKAESQSLSKQLASMKKENEDLECSVKYLTQDKEYLNRQLSDITVKYEMQTDSMQRSQKELEKVKDAREELYERYVSFRNENQAEYDRKLQEELDRLRLQTDTEMSKLRTDSKSVYERELKSMREARDIAIQERDRAIKNSTEAEKRNDSIMMELQTLKTSVDMRIAEAQKDATLKTFELEKLNIAYSETKENLLKYQEESEKLQKKLQLVTTEYNEIQKNSSLAENDLRNKLQLAENRLQAYEKLENELDDAVIQVAQLKEDDDEAEKVLFSYGYGANIPSHAKMRMRQSVQLARRILQLENINMSLNADLQTSKKAIAKLQGELSEHKKLLEQSEQPHKYLIHNLQEKLQEVEHWKNKTSELKEDVEKLQQENNKLVQIKKELSMDMDRLLNHQQELQLIKQVIKGLPQSNIHNIPLKNVDDGGIKPIVFSKKG